MLSVKLSFNGEVRRVTLYTSEKLSFQTLRNTAYNLFPSLREKPLTFLWSDDECDVVCCSTDEEVEEAIRVMKSENKTTFRFDVTIPASTSNPNPIPNAAPLNSASPSHASVVHGGVTCDGCGARPLTGVRYKCTVREDFDLCETCEQACVQPYPMIKIYDPSQAPAGIVVILRDEEAPHHPHHPHSHDGRGMGGHPRRWPGFGFGFGMGHPAGGGPGRGPPGCGRGPPGCGRGPPGCGRGPPGCGRGPPGCGRGPPGRGERSRFREGSGRRGYQSVDIDLNSSNPFIAVAEALDSFLGQVCDAPLNENRSPESAASAPQSSSYDGVPESSSAASAPESEAAIMEAQLIDEIIRESLLEAKDVAKDDVCALPVDEIEVPKLVIINSNEKSPEPLSMRFVDDVSCPDGTVIKASTPFVKTWRVVNNGSTAWPENVALVFSGGDMLVPANFKCSIGSIAAGSELEITVHMMSPSIAGRHIAFFRLTTRDEVEGVFGQRLWADIRIQEDDNGWMDVAVASSPAEPEASLTSSAKGSSPRLVTSGLPTAASNVNDEVTVEDVEYSEDEDFLPSSPPRVVGRVVPSASSPYDSQFSVLENMGLVVDRAAVLALLERHVRLDATEAARTLGFERVVNILLESHFGN